VILLHCTYTPTDMSERKSLLIVEDDPHLSKVLQTQFQGTFSVTVSADGAAAVEELKNAKFDVVILDLILPQKDGFTVLEEKVNTLNKETPVIVISNLREPHYYQRAIALGAAEGFVKAQLPLRLLQERAIYFASGPSKGSDVLLSEL
jgi:two-component system, OmpR family, response regulator